MKIFYCFICAILALGVASCGSRENKKEKKPKKQIEATLDRTLCDTLYDKIKRGETLTEGDYHEMIEQDLALTLEVAKIYRETAAQNIPRETIEENDPVKWINEYRKTFDETLRKAYQAGILGSQDRELYLEAMDRIGEAERGFLNPVQAEIPETESTGTEIKDADYFYRKINAANFGGEPVDFTDSDYSTLIDETVNLSYRFYEMAQMYGFDMDLLWNNQEPRKLSEQIDTFRSFLNATFLSDNNRIKWANAQKTLQRIESDLNDGVRMREQTENSRTWEQQPLSEDVKEETPPASENSLETYDEWGDQTTPAVEMPSISDSEAERLEQMESKFN